MQRQRENGQQGSLQEQTVLQDEDEDEEEEDEESKRQTPESTETGSIFYSLKGLHHAKGNKSIKVCFSIVI